jgi:hypothetical protein
MSIDFSYPLPSGASNVDVHGVMIGLAIHHNVARTGCASSLLYDLNYARALARADESFKNIAHRGRMQNFSLRLFLIPITLCDIKTCDSLPTHQRPDNTHCRDGLLVRIKPRISQVFLYTLTLTQASVPVLTGSRSIGSSRLNWEPFP